MTDTKTLITKNGRHNYQETDTKTLITKNGRHNYQEIVHEQSWGTRYWILSYTTNDPMDRHEFFHREDGPAIENKDGSRFWWYEGEYVECSSQQEFEKMLKLKAFW